MTAPKTPEEKVLEAVRLAREKNCFVVTKPGYWLVYRKGDVKNVCIGKRSKAETLLQLVKKA